MFLGVVILILCPMSSRSFMLIILSVVLSVLVPCLNLPGLTAQYVRAVGQDVSLGKCVLLSTSRSVPKAMNLWDVSGERWLLEGSAGCQGSWWSS